MPIQKCTTNGKQGYKFGDQGKCYVGPDAKKRAARQGRAIKARESTSNSGAYSGVGEEAVRSRKKYKRMLKEAGQ